MCSLLGHTGKEGIVGCIGKWCEPHLYEVFIIFFLLSLPPAHFFWRSRQWILRIKKIVLCSSYSWKILALERSSFQANFQGMGRVAKRKKYQKHFDRKLIRNSNNFNWHTNTFSFTTLKSWLLSNTDPQLVLLSLLFRHTDTIGSLVVVYL